MRVRRSKRRPGGPLAASGGGRGAPRPPALVDRSASASCIPTPRLPPRQVRHRPRPPCSIRAHPPRTFSTLRRGAPAPPTPPLGTLSARRVVVCSAAALVLTRSSCRHPGTLRRTHPTSPRAPLRPATPARLHRLRRAQPAAESPPARPRGAARISDGSLLYTSRRTWLRGCATAEQKGLCAAAVVVAGGDLDDLVHAPAPLRCDIREDEVARSVGSRMRSYLPTIAGSARPPGSPRQRLLRTSSAARRRRTFRSHGRSLPAWSVRRHFFFTLVAQAPRARAQGTTRLAVDAPVQTFLSRIAAGAPSRSA